MPDVFYVPLHATIHPSPACATPSQCRAGCVGGRRLARDGEQVIQGIRTSVWVPHNDGTHGALTGRSFRAWTRMQEWIEIHPILREASVSIAEHFSCRRSLHVEPQPIEPVVAVVAATPASCCAARTRRSLVCQWWARKFKVQHAIIAGAPPAGQQSRHPQCLTLGSRAEYTRTRSESKYQATLHPATTFAQMRTSFGVISPPSSEIPVETQTHLAGDEVINTPSRRQCKAVGAGKVSPVLVLSTCDGRLQSWMSTLLSLKLVKLVFVDCEISPTIQIPPSCAARCPTRGAPWEVVLARTVTDSAQTLPSCTPITAVVVQPRRRDFDLDAHYALRVGAFSAVSEASAIYAKPSRIRAAQHLLSPDRRRQLCDPPASPRLRPPSPRMASHRRNLMVYPAPHVGGLQGSVDAVYTHRSAWCRPCLCSRQTLHDRILLAAVLPRCRICRYAAQLGRSIDDRYIYPRADAVQGLCVREPLTTIRTCDAGCVVFLPDEGIVREGVADRLPPKVDAV
ncbi:hypothetical protein C8R47DRAFT_1216364 [Mycena vitilis]|nr:hypothetical protein C8R47DRAFT_1216364 [Mycena vitilis]